MSDHPTAILADVAARGIVLEAHGPALRFRPRSRMTPNLAQRIKAHKPAILARLAAPDRTPQQNEAIALAGRLEGVSSVLSVSERGLWCADELALLATKGATPADLPLVSAVKDAFAQWGASVVAVESTCGRGGAARREAGQLIWQGWRIDRGHGRALRDAYAERVAICTIDGGLSEAGAEQIALAELRDLPAAGITFKFSSNGLS